MFESVPRNDNNNRNQVHEYIPDCIHLLPWNGDLDDDNNPVRHLEIVEDPKKVETLLNRLNMDEKFITSQDRFHGGQRQKLWALYLMLNGDWDSRKRGGDKWKKYSRILRDANLEDIDWRRVPAEVFLFALTKRVPETNSVQYCGVCVFTEDSDAGKDLIKRLEIGAKKKREFQPRQAQQAVEGPRAPVEDQHPKLAGDGFINTPIVTVQGSKRGSRRKEAQTTPTYAAFPMREAEKGSGRTAFSSAKE